jgi:uncharacterized protein YbjT (DUF2867 family)
MKVILFGATGMVGQSVLRECLLDPAIESVLAVVRTPGVPPAPKLHELVHKDFLDFSSAAEALANYAACFWCLGVTSAGMSEEEYSRVTYGFTMAAARVLVARNPAMTFVFVSGASTDASEGGGVMWARVKGKTENAVARLPFKATYMFRPGVIQPLHGVTSKTRSYRILYAAMTPFFPLLKLVAPKLVTTSELLGRAMISVAKRGAGKTVLENADINAIGQSAT